MQDTQTGNMEPLDLDLMKNEGEQAAADAAIPDRKHQGAVISEGQEICIGDENNPAQIRGRIVSIGRDVITIEPLPGEAFTAGIKNKKRRRRKNAK